MRIFCSFGAFRLDERRKCFPSKTIIPKHAMWLFACLPGLLQPAHAQIFQVEVFVEALPGTFAAKSGLFDTAEGGDFGGEDAFVDGDHAGFEGGGDSPDAADVAGVEVGGEAKLGVVGEGDGLGFVVETIEGGDGAEGLFAGDFHGGGDFGEDGGLEEIVAERVTMASGEDFCALGEGVGEMIFDFGEGAIMDKRTLFGVGLGGGSDAEFGDGIG